jgi:hypothetical protein
MRTLNHVVFLVLAGDEGDTIGERFNDVFVGKVLNHGMLV